MKARLIAFFLFRSKLGGLGAWREFAANRWRSSGMPMIVGLFCPYTRFLSPLHLVSFDTEAHLRWLVF